MEAFKKIGESVLKWLLYATVIIPLLYFQNLYFPFIVVKAVYFRVIVAVAFILFAVLLLIGSRDWNWNIFRNKITWILGVTLGITFLSSILGLDFHHSFWSGFQRMEGLVMLLHLFAYFLLLSLVFKKNDWHLFLKFNLGVGVLVVLYAIGQLVNLPFLVDQSINRIDSTLNNAAFFASYLLFIFYLSLYASYTKLVHTYFSYALAVVSVILLFFTATRGAILGLLFSFFIFALFMIFRGKEKKYSYISLGFIIVCILVGITGFIFKDNLKNSNILFIERLASISLEDATTKSRLFIWSESLNYVAEKPFLGYGLENFEYIYNKFYNPDLIGEEWFDRSHNIYVDALIHTGILGFCALILLMFFILKALWPKEDEWGKMILFLLFISYFVQNFFVFDSISTLVLFYALLAFVGNEYFSPNSAHVSFNSPVVMYPMAGLVVILSISSLYFASYKPLLANVYLYDGYRYQIVDYTRSERSIQKGLDLNTFADLEYAYQMYTIYINQSSLKDQIEPKDLLQSYKKTAAHLKAMIEKYPWNTRLYVYLGHINEISPKEYRIPDNEMIEKLSTAITLTPLRDQPRYMIANIYLEQLQAEKDATKKVEIQNDIISVLKDYIGALPHVAEPKIVLANFLFDIGRKEEAEIEFREGIKTYKEDELLTRRIIDYYLKQKNYLEAEKYYEILVRLNSDNLDYHFDLGYLYFLNGKMEEATEKVNYVRARNPKILERNPNFVNNLLFNFEMQNRVNNIR